VDLAADEIVAAAIDGISRAVIAVDRELLVAAGHTATVVWRLDQSSPVAMTASGITGQESITSTAEIALRVPARRPAFLTASERGD
jgi:hypothetical protein